MSVTVVSDWSDVLDDQRQAAAQADRASTSEAQTNAARRTGHYASTIHPVPQQQQGDVVAGGITSDHPAASVIEDGRDVGPRKGPHMAGKPAIGPAGDRWHEHFESALGTSFR